jgi:hypothetical protein
MTFSPFDAEESREAFEAMCIRFRRLRQGGGGGGAFGNVRGALAHLIDESQDGRAVKDWLADLRRAHTHLTNVWAAPIEIRGSDGFAISPADALELVFNGEMFHGDPAKADELASRVGSWWINLAGELYLQIGTFSRLYMSLAYAVAAVLANPSNPPLGFTPSLSVEVVDDSVEEGTDGAAT